MGCLVTCPHPWIHRSLRSGIEEAGQPCCTRFSGGRRPLAALVPMIAVARCMGGLCVRLNARQADQRLNAEIVSQHHPVHNRTIYPLETEASILTLHPPGRKWKCPRRYSSTHVCGTEHQSAYLLQNHETCEVSQRAKGVIEAKKAACTPFEKCIRLFRDGSDLHTACQVFRAAYPKSLDICMVPLRSRIRAVKARTSALQRRSTTSKSSDSASVTAPDQATASIKHLVHTALDLVAIFQAFECHL